MPVGDTWELHGTTWVEIVPKTRPLARREHGLSYDVARGRVVLFGGQAGNQVGDTWEYFEE